MDDLIGNLRTMGTPGGDHRNLGIKAAAEIVRLREALYEVANLATGPPSTLQQSTVWFAKRLEKNRAGLIPSTYKIRGGMGYPIRLDRGYKRKMEREKSNG